MEIILLESVAKVGTKGAVVSIAPGHGQFLLKNGKATLATAKSKAAVEKATQDNAAATAKQAKDIENAIEKLGAKGIVIKGKASDKGHLFEGVHQAQIAAELSKATGVNIPESAVELKQAIKEIGEHTVGVATDSWEGTVTVSVEAE